MINKIALIIFIIIGLSLTLITYSYGDSKVNIPLVKNERIDSYNEKYGLNVMFFSTVIPFENLRLNFVDNKYDLYLYTENSDPGFLYICDFKHKICAARIEIPINPYNKKVYYNTIYRLLADIIKK